MSARTVIGASIVVRGTLAGEEDVVLHGTVEGRIAVASRVFVESDGRVRAEVSAESLRVLGDVKGNSTATTRIELLPGSKVVGDITAPRVHLHDGARFRGKIDMGGDVLA